MEIEVDARCGTCDYYGPAEKGYGQCEWLGPVPDALVDATLCMMSPDSGKHCRCWVRTVYRTSDSAEPEHG